MKKTILFFVIAIFAMGWRLTGGDVEISSGNLRILVNTQMQMKIENLALPRHALMPGFTSSEYIVTRYFTAKDFKLTSTTHKEIIDAAGEGTEWTLKGTYAGYPLEKVVSISTYKNYPGNAYFKVFYINKGKKDLPVEKWVNNNYNVIPSQNDSTRFWSFQGSSHADRRDWIQKVNPGLYHKNYMGMNATDYGGGIPVVDLWRKDAGGIAIGLTDSVMRLISIPVNYDQYADGANIHISYDYPDNKVLKPGETLSTYGTFAGVHKGNCFPVLRNYADYMQTKGIKPAPPENGSYEPMWCAWGYERDFTVQEIIRTLPMVKKLGMKWVGIDDGFQQHYGDWHTNPQKFAGGDAEMKALVDSIHSYGLKAMLWWNPVAVSPVSNFLKQHPDVLLIKKDGSPQYITWWDSFLISPTDSVALSTARSTVEMFLKDWGFDGLKLDGQNQNMCYPDYAGGHNISNPNQSYQLLPVYFKDIFTTARNIDPKAAIEFCPCGEVINFYIMPYMNQFVASDPESSWQVRTRALVYHALMPHTAFYGDHVELINDDFASQIGVGGVPGTKFVWPEIGTAKEKSLLLTPEKEKLYKKWIGLYNTMELSKGTYRGDLYDIGYNYPETHCIEKDGVVYYAVYNDNFNGKIQLKGLDPSKQYSVTDYFHNVSLGKVKGSNPSLNVSFRGFLMIAAKPVKK
ncbi:MAG: alpha-galactosidase [Chitinophagaceae bacterium]|nr:alpha-galactosidase [Chitinophagaceae bacterium]